MKRVANSSTLLRQSRFAELTKFIARKCSGDLRSFHGHGVRRFYNHTNDLVAIKRQQSSHILWQQRPVIITRCNKVSINIFKLRIYNDEIKPQYLKAIIAPNEHFYTYELVF